MPEITMCSGGNCPLKKDCYRYRAYPENIQSYFSEPPHKDGTCEYFMPFDKKETRIRLMEHIKEPPCCTSSSESYCLPSGEPI